MLAFLADGESWSSSALALALGASQRTVQRALDALAAAGKVQSFGRGRARRWMIPPVPGFPTKLVTPGVRYRAPRTEPMKTSVAEITREYGPFPGVEAVHGVSYDGEQVWFAAGDTLRALDPASGEAAALPRRRRARGNGLRRSVPVPDRRGSHPEVDPETGHVLATIPAPGGGGDSGLAWAEGTLWVGQYRDRKIHQVDPETGSDPSHDGVRPLRHRRDLGRRRALARHLGG